MTVIAERSAAPTVARPDPVGDLRADGWLFLPASSSGGPTELRGLRVWYPGWADLFRLRGADDAGAVRRDPGNSLVWQCDGTLTEVVDALLALPAPSLWNACPGGHGDLPFRRR